MANLVSLLKVTLTIIFLSTIVLFLDNDNASAASTPEVPWEHIITSNVYDYVAYDHVNYDYRFIAHLSYANIRAVDINGYIIYDQETPDFAKVIINIPTNTYRFGIWSYSGIGIMALERRPKNPPPTYSESTIWSVVQINTNELTQYRSYDFSKYTYSIIARCSYCVLVAIDESGRRIIEKGHPEGVIDGFLEIAVPPTTVMAGLANFSGKGSYALLRKRKNTLPTLDLSLTMNNQVLSDFQGHSLYTIEGLVRDVENDFVTITVTIDGKSKSVHVANTNTSKLFNLTFDVIADQISKGTHVVKVEASDGQGGSVTKSLSVIVKSLVEDNKFVFVDDPLLYMTKYADHENDPMITDDFMYEHNRLYFENDLGIISDSGTWRDLAYESLTKPGHYKIYYRAKDNPKSPNFEAFQLWSPPTPALNLYVHRKPVPRFTITVYSNGTGGFPTVIDETSYDLDKRSLNEGIAGYEWSWKDSTTVNWTNGVPPINLTANRSYDVKLRVQDHQGAWSDPLINTFTTTGAPILLNNPPVATMTNPSGTQALPTIITSLRPMFSWLQTDPDAATVFKSFEIQVTNEANTATIFNSGTIAQNTAATSKSWTVTKDLPTGQKLRVRVRVNDGLEWSAWSAQIWMYINRPPEAKFDWSPKPVWEGDTVTLTNQSTDLDGDALTYSWNISGPVSYSYTATTTHVSQKLVQPGNYTVRLTVSDGKAQASVTRTIRVESLSLEADVSYTALWLEHHLSMGHETVTHPKSFYTGEIFVVSAIGSLAATQQVTASLDAIGRDGQHIAISTELIVTNPANHFLGNLYDPILSSLTGSLPEGQYQINFVIEYVNGVIKEVSIPIQIIGHVQDAINVHRVQ